MAAYGDSLDTLAARLEGLLPDGPRDWSVDAAYYIALAFLALRRLKESQVKLTVNQRPLIEPALEQAYRELLYIRLKELPGEIMFSDVPRPVEITRTGRVNGTDSTPLSSFRGCYSNTVSKAKRRKRNAPASRKERLRARGTGKPDEPDDPGSGPKSSRHSGD